MTFLNPNFLFGLFAILIPIAVHLFNFHRYKKVYFTNVSALKEIEIKSKKSNELYKWLLLLSRCLLIASVVILFAQPVLKNDEKALVREGENAVVVFVDNSFSVKIDRVKQKAKQVADMYSSTDKFCLLTMDLAGKERHFVNKERFLAMLSEVETTPTSRMMSEVYETAHKLLNNENSNTKTSFFVSDFQKSCLDEENFKADSINNVFVSVETSDMNNIFIDSVWTEDKGFMLGSSVSLKVKVKNSGKQDVEKIPLKLIVDDKQVAVASLDMNAGEQRVIDMSFTVERNGILHSHLNILDSPVIFDNDFYFTLLVKDRVKVLCLNQSKENPYLMRLFENDAQVKIDNASFSNPNYNDFGSYSMIILNGLEEINDALANELGKFIDNSGSLMIIPNKDMDLESVNAFLKKMSLPNYAQLKKQNLRVNKYDKENYLFKDVFTTYVENISLPNSKMYFPIISTATTAKQSVLTYSNGEDFLAISPKNKSNVYMLSVGLDTAFSDFVNHSLFVPLMWNMCALSEVKSNLYYTIGEREFVELGSLENNSKEKNIFSLKGKNDSLEYIPQSLKNQNTYALKLHNQINKAGNYDVFSEGEVVSGFSLNYSSKESIMEFSDKKELKKDLKAYSSEKHFPFASIFIIIALFCVLFESILLFKLNKLK